jgi:transposase
MSKRHVSKTLWKTIMPLLPEPKPSPKGGRPPVSNRACLEGIISVLKSGMPWQMLPTKLGYGSGSTCWRRFRDWTRLEVWPELHQQLLRVLGRRGRINLERAVIDSASVRALKGGAHTGPNPTDRGKKGCKRHIVTDADGIPLVVRTGPANQPDAAWELEMLDAIPPCAGRCGRPRRRPEAFQGDGAYGIKAIVAAVVQRRIRSLLAPYGTARVKHGSGLGKTRYVVERTLSGMSNFRRLKLCSERFGEHFQAFHELAASLICANRVQRRGSTRRGF